MFTILRSRTLRFLAQLWVYVALAVLLTSIMAGFSAISDHNKISVLFVGNLLLSVAIGASMELGFSLTLQAPYAAKLATPLRVLVSAAVFTCCVLVGVELGLYAISSWAPQHAMMFARKSVLTISVPVSLAMMGLSFLYDRVETARAQQREAAKKLDEMRLSALSARTDPHFLFNAFNTIAALIQEDPAVAERALLKLSGLFRYVLELSRSNSVKLGDELAFARAYAELEALRFGERLHVRFEIDPALPESSVPPFILQPLVENAVRHGLSAPGRRTVRVLAARCGACLELCVDDDGPGPEASTHRGSATSQLDLKQRLALLYGPDAIFETGPSPLGGFRARIVIPQSLSVQCAGRDTEAP